MEPVALPTPVWTIVPFLAYLIAIAALPTAAARFWERNRNKLLVALVASLPVIAYLLSRQGAERLGGAIADYASFMALVASLFTISGGVVVRGALVASPRVNTALLGAGAVLGVVVGTTSASVLLIRPLLRANEGRPSCAHVFIFFIFVVSNAAGLLTPVGPPLYLGFLHGVPFSWTLRLLPQWALVSGALLVTFAVIDARAFARAPAASLSRPADAGEDGPLRVEGGLNILCLLLVVGLVFFVGTPAARFLGGAAARAIFQSVGTVALAAFAWKTTPPRIRDANRFSWAPVVEVAAIFVGIFVTMAPALSFLTERGAAFGVTKPWQFFWASGALSSVLDNAPTYLAFASLASGVVGTASSSPGDLGVLAAHPAGQPLLAAAACGSVFMGALTYIGNGPNFMIKAMAEGQGVRMPSFLGYMRWSFAILLPLFIVVTAVFF